MAVRYRFALPDDGPQLAELAGASRSEPGSAAPPTSAPISASASWIVAIADEQIIGEVRTETVGENGRLLRLFVIPEQRGRGIGGTLHSMALRGLHRMGARAVTAAIESGETETAGTETAAIETADTETAGTETAAIESRETFLLHLGWQPASAVGQQQTFTRELTVELLAANRSYWNAKAAGYAERQPWNDEIRWGIFGIADTDAGNIFPDVKDRDVLEIACGTAYVSYWAHLRGARSIVGLDNSPAQLATAVQRRDKKGVTLPLLQADGHQLPFADNSFDVAINEYGAAIWCDPRIWIPEAARVLRPGGVIWFLGNSVQLMLCAPEFEEELTSDRLLRAQKDMHRFEWIDTENVEFHVSHGEMISILTGAGFVIDALHELHAPADAPASYYGLADGEWASQWPIEEVWVASLPR